MNSSALSWDDLRFFLHIGRAGSLTAAAQTMAVSHATAFRHLQRLEAEIGVQLFNKTRAGYSLTAAGEDLMQVARKIRNRSGSGQYPLSPSGSMARRFSATDHDRYPDASSVSTYS